MRVITGIQHLVEAVLRARALTIRDTDAGEEPFLYSSGHWGPGYVTIKNLVGRKSIMKLLTRMLADELLQRRISIDFVAGNATGGIVPGWEVSEYLELNSLCAKTVPFVYVRESRKKGGHKELVTGLKDNPEIATGDSFIVVEELVNFAQTTCNSTQLLREAGYVSNTAACILFYENPESIRALDEHNLQLVSLFTLRELLEIAEARKVYPSRLIDAYRTYLLDPLGWEKKRNLIPVKQGGTL